MEARRLIWELLVITLVKVRDGGSDQGDSSGGGETQSGSRSTFLTNYVWGVREKKKK